MGITVGCGIGYSSAGALTIAAIGLAVGVGVSTFSSILDFPSTPSLPLPRQSPSPQRPAMIIEIINIIVKKLVVAINQFLRNQPQSPFDFSPEWNNFSEIRRCEAVLEWNEFSEDHSSSRSRFMLVRLSVSNEDWK